MSRQRDDASVQRNLNESLTWIRKAVRAMPSNFNGKEAVVHALRKALEEIEASKVVLDTYPPIFS